MGTPEQYRHTDNLTPVDIGAKNIAKRQLYEVFAGKVDFEIVDMVLAECNFNFDKAMDSLLSMCPEDGGRKTRNEESRSDRISTQQLQQHGEEIQWPSPETSYPRYQGPPSRAQFIQHHQPRQRFSEATVQRHHHRVDHPMFANQSYRQSISNPVRSMGGPGYRTQTPSHTALPGSPIRPYDNFNQQRMQHHQGWVADYGRHSSSARGGIQSRPQHSRPAHTETHPDRLLFIMRGLPGSGKSTLARMLKGDSGVLLSSDDFFEKDGKYTFDPLNLGRAHEWNQFRAKRAMEDGKSPIIIDNTNTKLWEMRPYVSSGLKHRYKIEFVEPVTTWAWNVAELARKNSHGVKEESIQKMLDRYDRDATVDKVMNTSSFERRDRGNQHLPSNPNAQYSRMKKSRSDTELRKSDNRNIVPTKTLSATVNPNISKRNDRRLRNTTGQPSQYWQERGGHPSVSRSPNGRRSPVVLETFSTGFNTSGEERQTLAEQVDTIMIDDDSDDEPQPQRIRKVRRQQQDTNENQDEMSISADDEGTASNSGGEESDIDSMELDEALDEFERRKRSRLEEEQDIGGNKTPKCDSTTPSVVTLSIDTDIVSEETVNPDLNNKDPEINNRSNDKFSLSDISASSSVLKQLEANLDKQGQFISKPGIMQDALNDMQLVEVLTEPSSKLTDKNVTRDIASIEDAKKLYSVENTFFESGTSALLCDPLVKDIQESSVTMESANSFSCTNISTNETADITSFDGSGETVEYSSQGSVTKTPGESLPIAVHDSKYLRGNDSHNESLDSLDISTNQRKDHCQASSPQVCTADPIPGNFCPDVASSPSQSKSIEPNQPKLSTCSVADSGASDVTSAIVDISAESLGNDSSIGNTPENRPLYDTPLPTVADKPVCLDLTLTDSDANSELSFLYECFSYVTHAKIKEEFEKNGGDVIKTCDALLKESCIDDVIIISDTEMRDDESELSETEDTDESSTISTTEKDRSPLMSNDISILSHGSVVHDVDALFDKRTDTTATATESSITETQSLLCQPKERIYKIPSHIATDQIVVDPFNDVSSIRTSSPKARKDGELFICEKERETATVTAAEHLHIALDYKLAKELKSQFGAEDDIDLEKLVPDDFIVDVEKKFSRKLYRKWTACIQKRRKRTQEMLKLDEEYAKKLQLQEEESSTSLSSSETDGGSISKRALRPKSVRKKTAPFTLTSTPSVPFQPWREVVAGRKAKTAAEVLEEERKKRKKLHDMFPGIDENALDEVLLAMQYNLEGTINLVRASCGILNQRQQNTRFNPQSTVVSAKTLNSLMEENTGAVATDTDIPSRDADFSSGIYQTFTEPSYGDFRAEAQLHANLRAECFRKAAKAHAEKQGDLAARYAEEGRTHTEKMREAHSRAAALILQKKNENRDRQAVLDLHGLHVNEALEALEAFLYEAERKGHLRTVEVITGRGNHSKGGVAKLKPVILKRLIKLNYRFEPLNQGSIKVWVQ